MVCVVCSAVRFGLRQRSCFAKEIMATHYEMDPGLFRLRPSPQKFKDWLYIEIGRDQILHGDYPKELKDEFKPGSIS